jgi:hypothetical protein
MICYHNLSAYISTPSLPIMEDTTVAEDNSTQHYRQQFAAAIAVAACKVEKKEKEEMPAEMFQRITQRPKSSRKTRVSIALQKSS